MAITISDTEPRVQYTATSSQTTFSVPFEFFTVNDIKVYNGSSLLSYNASPSSASQYSVTGAGVTGGGQIVLGGGATLNDIITIYRDLAISRSTDFPTSGAFQIDSLNTELDKIIAMSQQLERDLKFSPKAAATTSNTFNLTFPNLVADKILSVNSAGTALEFDQSITDVTTVAGLSSEITALDAIAANITTVAGIAANVTSVAGDATDIGAVAAKATEIGRLGTADAVADLAILGTTAIVADMAILATTDVVSDMNVLASADFVSDLNTLASSGIVTDMDLLATSANVTAMGLLGVSGVITNMGLLGTSAVVTDMGLLGTSAVITDMDLLATSAVLTDMDLLATSANVTAMGVLGTSANVTAMATVSTNIAGVNSFADRYRISSSAPGTSLDVGDLYFDTAQDELKVYKSSGWAAAGSTVNGTSKRYTYNISGTPTTVTGSDAKGDTLAYDAGFVDVYLNGTRLSNSDGAYTGDVTVTSGTTVTFASALTNGDVVDIVAYGTFNVAAVAGSAITSGTIAAARMPVTIAAVWESKSANFTAAAGKAYFCDTSGGAIDVTLPSPTIGDTIRFLDVSGTFDTNDLTILNGSSKIQGASANLDVATERAGFELVYYNTTHGWLLKDK